MTDKVWEKAFSLLMECEGGYVCDANDNGGETKYGISKKAYPNVDICSLTLWQAKDIYRRDYWDKIKGDYLPDALSIMVFDFAVNSGVKQASKILQRCLRVTDDGIIGKQTICASNSCNVRNVVEEYTQRKLDFYLNIVEKKPSQKKFLKGWINRIKRVERVCEELCLNK